MQEKLKTSNKLDINIITNLKANLSKDTTLIALDIYKCYDNIDLTILNNMILNDANFDEIAKREWIDTLLDLYALNYDLNGKVIYRTKGIPQGSILAPFICNYYISRIINQPHYQQFIKELKITIYADNIFIVCKEKSDQEIEDIITNFKILFDLFKLKFNKPQIVKFNKIISCTNTNYINDESKAKNIKILGLPLINYENTITVDLKKIKFKFIEPISQPGYKAVKRIRKYIIPKYNFYRKIISNWTNDNTKENYTRWFKINLREFLQKSIINVKFSDIFINYIIDKNSINIQEVIKWLDYNGRFYSYWLQSYDDFKPDEANNYKIINTIKKLGENLLQNQKKFNRNTIYKILKENTPVSEFKTWPNEYGKEDSPNYRETFKALDHIYFTYITKQNIFGAFDEIIL